MRTVLPTVGGLALLLGLAAPAFGQHHMEIYNGSTRTVYEFGPKGDMKVVFPGPGDLADQVQALLRQYVVNERALEARRRTVQQLLYGYETTYPTSLYPATLYGGPYGWYYPLSGWYGGWGWPYGGGGVGWTTHSLAPGIGPEGAVKMELVRMLPRMLAPPVKQEPAPAPKKISER
jgi:hypothetical protein